MWEQVGSADAAKLAVDDGVAVVIVQGWEAGGHNYGGLPTMVGVPAVVDAVGDHVPARLSRQIRAKKNLAQP